MRKKARRRRAKQTEEGDKYHMWGRRRNGLTANFTLAVYMQFLVAADTYGISRRHVRGRMQLQVRRWENLADVLRCH
jgi:hypothetical protein